MRLRKKEKEKLTFWLTNLEVKRISSRLLNLEFVIIFPD